MPMGHRLFFKVISQNREYVEKFCDDSEILFIFMSEMDQSIKLKIIYNFVNLIFFLIPHTCLI